MKKIKINQKKIKLERKKQLSELKKEFEAEYFEKQKLWKEYGFENDFPLEPLEDFLALKCKEWEESQLQIPTGMYQDEKKILSHYQQKFIEFTCQLCPQIFEELRQFVPLFNELFGDEREKYNLIFDTYRMEIFELNSSLFGEIGHPIVENPFLWFKPERYKNFDYGFVWGEYYLLFNILMLKFARFDDSESRKELISEVFELIVKELKVSKELIEKGIGADQLENFKKENAIKILEYLLNENECKYYFDNAKNSIARFFRENLQDYVIPPENLAKVEPFIKLQFNLLRWAKKYNLRKDWILRYAYYFISEYSKNINIKISEIEIHRLKIRSLFSYSFDFKFNGWLPGDEKREVYEQRLRESFEDELAKYFHGISINLDLDKVKKMTRPPDYNRVKNLVRWTVQEWSIEKIIETDFEIYNNFEMKEKFESKLKYFEEELPKFEEFGLPFRKPVGKSFAKI